MRYLKIFCMLLISSIVLSNSSKADCNLDLSGFSALNIAKQAKNMYKLADAKYSSFKLLRNVLVKGQSNVCRIIHVRFNQRFSDTIIKSILRETGGKTPSEIGEVIMLLIRVPELCTWPAVTAKATGAMGGRLDFDASAEGLLHSCK